VITLNKKTPNLKLKALMVEKQVTQKKICEDLKMNIVTFNRNLNGIREFSESEIQLISEYLGVSPVEIFFNLKVDKCTTKTA
jgi:transcriptional regulator with XRE-family HTH domain